MDPTKFTLHIEDVAPTDLPMRRLAAYLEQYARLLGEEKLVRLDSITDGSTKLNAYAPAIAAPKVRDRLEAVQQGAQDEGRRIVNKIDAMLREDNASGSLSEDGRRGAIIRFPGAHARVADMPVVTEASSLQGVLVRVGGRDDTAHALLRDGEEFYSCVVGHDLARALGQHLLGPVLRLHGRGRWRRGRDDTWEVIYFKADTFDVLDNASLEEASKKLRAVGGFGHRDAVEARNTLQKWRKG